MVVARTAVLLAVLLAAKLAPSLAARTAREAQPCESDWLLGDLGGDDHVVGNHLDDDCLSTAHRLDELPGLLRCRRGIKTVGMDQRHGGSHSRPDDHKPRAARGGRAPRRALWGDEPSGPVRPARLPRPRPPKLVASRPPAPARTAWGGIAGRPLLPVDTDEGPAFQMPRPAAHPTSRGWNPFSEEPERHVTRTGILLPPYLPEDVIAAPATGVATAEDRPDNPAVLRSPRRIEHRSPEAPPPSPPPPPSSPPPTSSRSSSGRARAASVEQELRKAWENIAAHRVDIPVSSNNNNIKIKVKVSSAQALNSQQHQQQPKAKQQQQRTRTLHQDEEEGRMLAELLYRLARRAEEISARLEHLANTATRRVSSGAQWDAVPTRTAPRRASGASNRASAVITKVASSAASNAARRSSQSSARGSSVEQQSTPRKRGWRRDQYAETPPHGQRRACE